MFNFLTKKSKITSKKMLVPIDVNNPNVKKKGFLCPNFKLKNNSFLNIDSAAEYKFGMVVFVGMEISSNDILERVIDAKLETSPVDGLLETFDDYLLQINLFKIGDIVEIRQEDNKFKLHKLKK